MNFQHYSFYIALMLSSVTLFNMTEKRATPGIEATSHSDAILIPSSGLTEDFTHILLFCPLDKLNTTYTVFLNRKNIGRITRGGRMDCHLRIEGLVAITVTEDNTYHEPATLSANSRTITIKRGNAYYFRISKLGQLEYFINPEKGEKAFDNAKDFTIPPLIFVETGETSIPSLNLLGL